MEDNKINENQTPLCKSCTSGIWCRTWAEMKCSHFERRIYGYSKVTACTKYTKKPKDWVEKVCRCEDCLKNELLAAENDEEK